jgi:hypothetical protein
MAGSDRSGRVKRCTFRYSIGHINRKTDFALLKSQETSPLEVSIEASLEESFATSIVSCDEAKTNATPKKMESSPFEK